MDFDLTEAQQEIVNGVRALCARFDDEYWRAQRRRARISARLLPGRGQGRLPGSRDSRGIRRQRARHHRGRIGDARGRVRGRDERRQRDPSVDLRPHADRDARHRGDEATPSAARGQRRVARRLRRDRTRRRQRHHPYQDLRQARGRQLRDQRAQGLHHQGAGSAQDAAADAHHAVRAGGEEDRRDEPVLRRPRPRRGRGARAAQARTPCGRHQHAVHRQPQGLGR